MGYLSATNSSYNPIFIIIFGSLGNTLGNFILYYLIYTKSNFFTLKLKTLLNINDNKLNIYTDKIKKHSFVWLLLGKLTPSVKVFIPFVAAILKINPMISALIFFLGSLVWASILVSIGYFFGEKVSLLNFYLILGSIYLISFLVFKFKSSKK